MKFGDFLFPESSDPGRDGAVIDDAWAEARLCDELGMDAIWLAEHHFDGNCAYVDPLTFAAALALATKRVELGFAVIQTSLYHPHSPGRAALPARSSQQGTADSRPGPRHLLQHLRYQGYGIDADEAQARFEEAEEILRKAWTSESFEHRGRFWNLRAPSLRPRPYTKPHPEIYRGHLQRGLAQGVRPAGPPDPAESAEQRDDAAAGGCLSARHARRWLWRGRNRTQRRQDLGLAQHLCRPDRRSRRSRGPAGFSPP